MKHIKEWNTCDRCGVEIKNTLIRKGKAKIKSKYKKVTILIVCLTILELFCTQKKQKLTYALNAGKSLRSG